MAGRIATFGLGALAGLGVGAGYWRDYQQLELSENQETEARISTNPTEQQLFK